MPGKPTRGPPLPRRARTRLRAATRDGRLTGRLWRPPWPSARLPRPAPAAEEPECRRSGAHWAASRSRLGFVDRPVGGRTAHSGSREWLLREGGPWCAGLMGTRDRTTARAAPSNADASFGDSVTTVKTEYPFLLSSSLSQPLVLPPPFYASSHPLFRIK